MKASELMIGNWVLDGGVKTQVTSITCDGNIETTKRMSNEEIVEPIPLTAEILEKNGFHKEWDEDIILMVYDTIIVKIGYMYKMYKDGKMYLHGVLAPLYYVHQLQNAMRIMGCEKEIEL